VKSLLRRLKGQPKPLSNLWIFLDLRSLVGKSIAIPAP
jgi:hypothetical protein